MKFFRYVPIVLFASMTAINAAQQAPTFVVAEDHVPQVQQDAQLGNGTILRKIVGLAFDHMLTNNNTIAAGDGSATQVLGEIDRIVNNDCRKIITEVFWSKVCLAYVLNMVRTYTFNDANLCVPAALYNNVTAGLAANNVLANIAYANNNNVITFTYRGDNYSIDIHTTITHISTILTRATAFVQRVQSALNLAGSALLQARVIRYQAPNAQQPTYITLLEYMNMIQDLCEQIAQDNFLTRVNDAINAFARRGGTYSNDRNRSGVSDSANTRLKEELIRRYTTVVDANL